MTKVAILPVPTETGGVTYQGVAGEKSSQGNTIGEALDALTRQFSEEESGLMIVVVEGFSDKSKHEESNAE